jgi:uncharacterized protein
MKVAITGASGLIGNALVRVLRANGHEVRRLVRHDPQAADQSRWNPDQHEIDDAVLDEIEAVIHLAGVGVGDKRWSDSHKRAVLQSRVDGTTTIAEAVARNSDHVRVLLSASAVGWYGERGDAILDEADPAGTGFLADVVERWEASTAAASDAGVRVANLRSGIVLSADGGALGKVLPLFKAGVGGRLGGGHQYISWIARPDHIAAMRFLLDADDISGPVNLTAPNPVTNRDYTKAIAAAVHRPALFPAPTIALKAVLGEFADNVVGGQRVLPKRLLDAGFEFGYPDIGPALRALVEAHA